MPELAFDLGGSIFQGLAMLLMLYSMRLLLRRELAAIGARRPHPRPAVGDRAGSIVTGIAPFIVQVLGFAAIARVGIVAGIAAIFMGTYVLYQFPVTIPPDGWHAGVGMLGLGIGSRSPSRRSAKPACQDQLIKRSGCFEGQRQRSRLRFQPSPRRSRPMPH